MGRNQGGDKRLDMRGRKKGGGGDRERDAGGEEKGVSRVALDGRNSPASITTNTTSSLRWHECLFGMLKKKGYIFRSPWSVTPVSA